MNALAVPARYTFRDLVHADALIAAHSEQYTFRYDDNAAYFAWASKRDDLLSFRNAEMAKVSLLLCRKCEGTGMTGWLHRYGGVCFTCKGDGWSAKGRRAVSS